MKMYCVTYETRKNGAIGVFSPERAFVYADNAKGAVPKAREALSINGRETRFPLKVQRMGDSPTWEDVTEEAKD